MKKLFPILLTCFVLVVFASAARAQWLEGDVYSFGEQRIRVPAPEGFTDTFGRINRVAGPYIAGESDSNITLAVHIPRETAEQLEADDDAPLDFCTRVTTPKAYLSIDVESDLFSRMVLGFNEAAPGMAEPFKPEAILKAETAAEDGTPASEITHLGYIERGPNVFSGLMLSGSDTQGQLLSSVSLVNVNDRLVIVYVHRQFASEKDADIVRDLTKKWTAAIIAANGSLPS